MQSAHNGNLIEIEPIICRIIGSIAIIGHIHSHIAGGQGLSLDVITACGLLHLWHFAVVGPVCYGRIRIIG